MQKKRFIMLIIIGLLFVVIFAMAGCTTGNKPATGNHIRYALSAEPESIDPRMSTSLSGSAVEAQLFEGLTTLDANNRPVAAAAERWQISPDGRKITFVLRAGLKWSNGEPVTAQDFEYAWKTGLSPGLASPNALCCIA